MELQWALLRTKTVRKQKTRLRHSLCLGFLQLNSFPWLQKEPPAVSCATICMKKGPSKNIFLSFQAISLIPDELQGRGKHYGCGLAGGEEGILCVVRACAYAGVCVHVFDVWLHCCKASFNDWTFLVCIYVYTSLCVCKRNVCVDI